MATQYVDDQASDLDGLDGVTRRQIERLIQDTYDQAARARVRIMAEAGRYRELVAEVRVTEQAWRDHVHGACALCSTPGAARCSSEEALDRAADEAQRALGASLRRLGLKHLALVAPR